MAALNADDRVLVIGLAQRDLLASWARQCRLLVGIGAEDEVRAARRECAELDNVMFTPGSRDQIPWGDGRFTVVIDLEGGGETAEMRRVLAAGGRVLPGL